MVGNLDKDKAYGVLFVMGTEKWHFPYRNTLEQLQKKQPPQRPRAKPLLFTDSSFINGFQLQCTVAKQWSTYA